MSTAHLLNLPGQLAQSEALQPNASTSIERWVLQGTFTPPKGGSHFPRVFPNSKLTLTSKQSSTKNAPSKNPETLALNQSTIQITPSKLCKKHWFHSLPFQRFQALLTLFPKSFSSFPHGTCLLSVSGRYLALDENYHPFCAPSPKYATLKNHSGCAKLSTWTGFSPSLTFFSKKTYAGDDTRDSSQDYNSKTSFGFTFWALPGSVALTKGIIFIFFSSAYLYA